MHLMITRWANVDNRTIVMDDQDRPQTEEIDLGEETLCPSIRISGTNIEVDTISFQEEVWITVNPDTVVTHDDEGNVFVNDPEAHPLLDEFVADPEASAATQLLFHKWLLEQSTDGDDPVLVHEPEIPEI